MSADDERDFLFMGVEPERLDRPRIYMVLVRSDELPEPKPEPPPAAPSCVCSPGHRRLCFFRSKECPCE